MGVAEVVLELLGEDRFSVATGVTLAFPTDDGLYFTLPKKAPANGANKVHIILGRKYYKVRFWFMQSWYSKLISEHKGVRPDQLRALFTKETGLDIL